LVDAEDARRSALAQLSFTDDRDDAAKQFGLDGEFGSIGEAQVRKDISTALQPLSVA
jgi:hypothetical protein